MESILTSAKRLSGVMKENECFDDEIIMYVNSVFMVLKQLGVGPSEGFAITDESSTWHDFLPNDEDKVLREYVKDYMGAKVKLRFDPPSNSSHMEALVRSIEEFEWRSYIEEDPIE